MANLDECVIEFTSMSAKECEIAQKNKNVLCDNGASSVLVLTSENKPNKIEIWGPTYRDVEKVADKLEKLVSQIK